MLKSPSKLICRLTCVVSGVIDYIHFFSWEQSNGFLLFVWSFFIFSESIWFLERLEHTESLRFFAQKKKWFGVSIDSAKMISLLIIGHSILSVFQPFSYKSDMIAAPGVMLKAILLAIYAFFPWCATFGKRILLTSSNERVCDIQLSRAWVNFLIVWLTNDASKFYNTKEKLLIDFILKWRKTVEIMKNLAIRIKTSDLVENCFIGDVAICLK